MDRLTARLTFNGPLESGMRTLALLASSYPRTFDIGQLTALDFLLVRTNDFNGPDNLHPPSPIQAPDATVRRKTVQHGIDLMLSRDLIERTATVRGIEYAASDSAIPFLEALSSAYIKRLRERADWITAYFEGQSHQIITQTVREIFDKWVMEFQDIEQSSGARP